MDLKVINDFWPLVTAIAGVIVWLVRIEGLTKQNQKDIDRVEKNHDNLKSNHETLDSKVVEQLAQVREALARIEGYLRASKE